jgi:hypothetical protein
MRGARRVRPDLAKNSPDVLQRPSGEFLCHPPKGHTSARLVIVSLAQGRFGLSQYPPPERHQGQAVQTILRRAASASGRRSRVAYLARRRSRSLTVNKTDLPPEN